ncbi:MAG: carboxypeptidase-like regulatory domain-containing protein [Deltaproteobacteria bacterium]|nr:carboxypeptidase-like regulatory domain-containing protein [Deltaproteobacteria bacterium]
MIVSGTVQDVENEKPLEGAIVEIKIGTEELGSPSSDSEGKYYCKRDMKDDCVGKVLVCKVVKEGYQTKEVKHDIVKEINEVELNIELNSKIEKIELKMSVKDENEKSLKKAQISLKYGTKEICTCEPDESGNITTLLNADLINKEITYEAVLGGYDTEIGSFSFEKGKIPEIIMKFPKPVVVLSIKDEIGKPLKGVKIILESEGKQVANGYSQINGIFESELKHVLEEKTIRYKAVSIWWYKTNEGDFPLKKETSQEIIMNKLPVPWLIIAAGVGGAALIALIVFLIISFSEKPKPVREEPKEIHNTFSK